jgi:hypothetical protein
MPQLLRRRQGNPGIQPGNLEHHNKQGQVGPVGDKGLEVDAAHVVEVYQKETSAEGEHNPKKIGPNHGGCGEGGAGAPVSGAIPNIEFMQGHPYSMTNFGNLSKIPLTHLAFFRSHIDNKSQVIENYYYRLFKNLSFGTTTLDLS